MDVVETLKQLAQFVELSAEADQLTDQAYDISELSETLDTEQLRDIYTIVYRLEELHYNLDMLAYDTLYESICDLQSHINTLKDICKEQ